MTRHRQGLGKAGEDLAARHLESRGFTVVARRYRTRMGEIDLVATSGDLVAFIEVKTRRGTGFGLPAESVNPVKQARLTRVAALFLAGHPALASKDLSCRFDVIGIVWQEGRPPRLEHIEDAFRPAG
jgi:putative endonuclease